eukprot:3732744-Lingulodinium_polyedra.AAC.1
MPQQLQPPWGLKRPPNRGRWRAAWLNCWPLNSLGALLLLRALGDGRELVLRRLRPHRCRGRVHPAP